MDMLAAISDTDTLALNGGALDTVNLTVPPGGWVLAVDGPTNQQKSDGDAATWLPPNKSYRCDYVARQISVKSSYGLWVTRAEHDAMARVLADCRDTATPAGEGLEARDPGNARYSLPRAFSSR